MKLYYWPGACSLSPHIVSREAGIDLQLAQLDRAERKTADGTVLSSVNPKNQVPVLEMDDGQKLTEGPVIVQYLADLKPASGLVPPLGSVDATSPGMAQLHQLGAAQDLFAAVPPDHAGRLQGSLA